jgi:hypothetical protein
VGGAALALPPPSPAGLPLPLPLGSALARAVAEAHADAEAASGEGVAVGAPPDLEAAADGEPPRGDSEAPPAGEALPFPGEPLGEAVALLLAVGAPPLLLAAAEAVPAGEPLGLPEAVRVGKGERDVEGEGEEDRTAAAVRVGGAEAAAEADPRALRESDGEGVPLLDRAPLNEAVGDRDGKSPVGEAVALALPPSPAEAEGAAEGEASPERLGAPEEGEPAGVAEAASAVRVAPA